LTWGFVRSNFSAIFIVLTAPNITLSFPRKLASRAVGQSLGDVPPELSA